MQEQIIKRQEKMLRILSEEFGKKVEEIIKRHAQLMRSAVIKQLRKEMGR